MEIQRQQLMQQQQQFDPNVYAELEMLRAEKVNWTNELANLQAQLGAQAGIYESEAVKSSNR